MKDEIKEIQFDHFKDLEELKQNVENWIKIDEEYWERWFGLSDIKILLDYITNLQEAIETIKSTNKLLIQQKAQLQDDLDMLDNRIDKAIEYTKTIDDWDIKDFRRNNILKILKGKSDE